MTDAAHSQVPYAPDPEDRSFRGALRSGEVPIAVYGLGKMGLPLAAVYADVTGNVVGADVDESVVRTINSGGCHVEREPGLAPLVERLSASGALEAVSDTRAAAERASVHVVIVPTPITAGNEPDLSILDSVTEDIAHELTAGDLVLIECTVPPRTCVDRVLPLLEEKSRLDREEFGVAFCPERTSSGRALQDIRGAYPKVVGGADELSTSVARIIYKEINSEGVIPVSDITTAEAVKVFEGLYRDVNIGLANELAQFADELEIDINEAIATANTQPYCDIHDPGPGVGGHCIPFYPYFMIEPFETDTPLLSTARQVNDSMSTFTVEKIREELSAEGTDVSSASVLVLGLTYRPGVKETTASPAFDISEELATAGADVYGVDPMVEDFDPFELSPLEQEEIYHRDFDAVVLVTPHKEFSTLDWEGITREEGQLLVIDGRDALDGLPASHRVYTIGGGFDVP